VAATAVRASGLTPAHGPVLAQARALAAARIGPGVASVESLEQIEARWGAAVLVHWRRRRVTGALGVAPLTSAGLAALGAGMLDLATPDLDYIAGDGEPAAALYAMGIVATDPDAARAVVGGVVRLRQAFPELPFYARAVTPEGRRVLIERLDCVDLGDSLFCSPPTLESKTAVVAELAA
jgi:hypothetical protein